MRTNLVKSPSSKSNFNILAPSLLATAGFSCVSINRPSAPTAIPAFAMVSISCGHAACDAAGLVGLLQGVGNIQDNGETERLHFRYSAIVYYEVLIAERCSAFCNHNVLISGLYHLVCRKTAWQAERGTVLSLY